MAMANGAPHFQHTRPIHDPTAVLSPFLSLTPPLQAIQEVDESLNAR